MLERLLDLPFSVAVVTAVIINAAVVAAMCFVAASVITGLLHFTPFNLGYWHVLIYLLVGCIAYAVITLWPVIALNRGTPDRS
jgi:hypothetical protein